MKTQTQDYTIGHMASKVGVFSYAKRDVNRFTLDVPLFSFLSHLLMEIICIYRQGPCEPQQENSAAFFCVHIEKHLLQIWVEFGHAGF